jgi:hypothetical protein
VSSSFALGANGPETGVINGGILRWNSSNALQLSAGWVFSNGSQNPITENVYDNGFKTKGNANLSSVTWTATSSTCAAQNSQQASSVYYVYYDYVSPNNSILIVSTVGPYHDAYPGSALYWGTAGSCQTGQLGLVFVGSFMTDQNGDMRPFTRQGDDVFVVSPVSTPGTWTNGGIWNWTWRPFGAGAHSEVIQWTPMPVSASALIVSASGWNWDTTSSYTFFVLDSMGLGAPVQQGGNWKFNTQAVFFINQASAATQAGSFQFQGRQLRIKPDSSGNVTLWTQTAPTAQNVVDIDMGLVGYVEAIRSPGF